VLKTWDLGVFLDMVFVWTPIDFVFKFRSCLCGNGIPAFVRLLAKLNKSSCGIGKIVVGQVGEVS
jgi:hypothetical protein